MKRMINKVAVIGSGIMGSGIACHFANIGLPVLLLDICPNKLTPEQTAKGLTLEHPLVKNSIVQQNLIKTVKSNPAPLYHSSFIDLIEVGNLTDDISKIKEVDWVIEVVVEKLEIKNQIFKLIDQHRKLGSIVSSNTSGIPIKFMNIDKSDDFKKHFVITHFFNPPRYLKLFEIVPGPDCKPEIVDFLQHFSSKFLGKTPVIAKDTPAFIGNRIGIFGMMNLFQTIQELDLSINDIDKLTGPIIGRPKSATFRTVDVVGLDTLVHVANGLYENCKNDEANQQFIIPPFVTHMLNNNMLGSKTQQGFYKKTKNENGENVILSLNLKTLAYENPNKSNFTTLEMVKNIPNVIDRFKILIDGKDLAGTFYRKNLAALFSYVSHRIPEISEDLFSIDNAMKAGFGWEHGPFEIWDAIGVEKGISLIKNENLTCAAWVTEIPKGNGFYQIKEGIKQYFDLKQQTYSKIPGQDTFIILDHLRSQSTIWSNAEASIQHLGNGVLNVEFQSKMNTIGSGVLQAINKGIDLAENEYDAVILGNQAANFSVGANLAMVYMLAIEQEYDELNFAVKYFQDTVMRMRYSNCPTLITPRGMTLGGGCELSLHADKVIAAAETYTGLVEFGVGVIPGGGGTKEMTKRALENALNDDVKLNRLRNAFINIAMAKVTTSGREAMDLGYFKKHKDLILVNEQNQIATAKKHALQMLTDGYIKPTPEKVKVMGQQVLGMFQVGADSLVHGHYATEHDKLIANKLGYVMAGGNLSEPTEVTEQYLLDLERDAFLSLLGERKTLERIQFMLKTGKPLRN